MKCIILAGGYAKRLWPLTLYRPKPLLPVAGKPIIDYLLDDILAIEKIDKVYVSTNAAFEKQFREWVQGKDPRVELVIEETRSEDEKLGALGALDWLMTGKGITEETLILGGDNLVEFNIADMANAYDGRPMVAVYDLGSLEKASKYGIMEMRDDIIVGCQEKPENPKSTLASTAFYLYSPRTIKQLHDYCAAGNNRDAPGKFIEWLHKQEEVKGFVFKGEWFDIGDRDSYIRANTKRMNGHSFIAESSKVSGEVTNCVVLDNVIIENCVLENCVIDSDSILTNVELRDSIVGSYARLEGMHV